MSDGSAVSFPLSISCLATHAAERLCRSGRERNYRREPGNGGWRRSANRVVKGPSPKDTATARLRRKRSFPPSPRNGEVRPDAVTRAAVRLRALMPLSGPRNDMALPVNPMRNRTRCGRCLPVTTRPISASPTARSSLRVWPSTCLCCTPNRSDGRYAAHILDCHYRYGLC
jgi:hypothetical protein